MNTSPRWLKLARNDIGLREIPGKAHSPRITSWLIELGAWWRDDETPWCGVAVAAWMRAAGVPLPKHWYRAKAWADGWGITLAAPIRGCVVVFDRVGGGHVGLVDGRLADGTLLVLGGNQGNEVNVSAFPPSRPGRFFWPAGEPIPPVDGLAVQFAANVPVSRSEA